MYESYPLRGQVDQLRMPLENVVRRPELGEYRQNHEYRDDCGPSLANRWRRNLRQMSCH